MIKENLLLPIVTQVPLGLYGQTDGKGKNIMSPKNFAILGDIISGVYSLL
jgi:hypothetical protein